MGRFHFKGKFEDETAELSLRYFRTGAIEEDRTAIVYGKSLYRREGRSVHTSISDAVVSAVEVYLQLLHRNIPHSIGAIAASPDGLPIADDLPGYVEPTALAALAAVQTSLSQRFMGNAHGCELHNVVMRCAIGYIVLYAIGEAGSLTILLTDEADLTRADLEARPVIHNLTYLLAR